MLRRTWLQFVRVIIIDRVLLWAMRIDFVGVFSLFLRVLSSREVRLGEEIAWYADGDTIVRSEQNHSIAYAYGMCPILVPGFPGMDGSHFCYRSIVVTHGCLV